MLFSAVNKDGQSRRFLASDFEQAEAIAEQKGWTDVGLLVAEYSVDGEQVTESKNAKQSK